ncbi:MAG: Crp/Fnr family transcriptional regulator [Phenylobacterium sp.]|uniref:Crp/Fnr family transcriptional regulator n=1 Tax=Phenylobacterium sp. TaxID=1871053 RepID=UPI0027325E5D|nr:Crp/Fnr family transcriptional regulator [Phenylobacterium sp.]MDP3174950.1 Crp/Fnr family transcriptional regulator [Phenylobacterium sp.]
MEEPGVDIWVRNLRRRDHTLTADEEGAMRSVLSEVIEVPADQDVVREHDRQRRSHLLLEGWAGRYVTLSDGRRQIVALHVPGDFVDLHSLPLQVMDHSVATFTPCRIALAPHERLRAVTASQPHVARLLWLSTLIDAAILRQWLVGSGKRTALEQTAHLFCELYVRLELTGRAEQGRFAFPLSQSEVADCLGISAVHANRVFQELRSTETLSWRGRQVEIRNWDALTAIAEFDPTYLNLFDIPR